MTFGVVPGFPELHVLDSTVPAQVRSFEKRVDLAKTLCIVASKSGSTTEPLVFYRYFFDRMRQVRGDKAGENFIAITDPGFYGLLAGTAFADAFTVLSERGVVIDAGAGDDNITTGGGSDEIRPGPGSDTVSAGGGDDRIIVNRFEGDKRIDGGTGIDILSIDRSIGSISGRLEDGKIVIYDAKGGSLSAANVNIYEFADALYVQAGTQPEAVVAWMYKTWLGHTPDAKGMQYWLDQVAAGRPLADMERGFANAIKTTSLYTDTSDEEFLDGLYARAFDPATDLPERSFWLQQLQTGAMTRDQIITDLVALEEAQVTITGVVLIPGTL